MYDNKHQSNSVMFVLKRETLNGSFGSKQNEADRIDERIFRSRMRASFCRVARALN